MPLLINATHVFLAQVPGALPLCEELILGSSVAWTVTYAHKGATGVGLSFRQHPKTWQAQL